MDILAKAIGKKNATGCVLRESGLISRQNDIEHSTEFVSKIKSQVLNEVMEQVHDWISDMVSNMQPGQKPQHVST